MREGLKTGEESIECEEGTDCLDNSVPGGCSRTMVGIVMLSSLNNILDKIK